MKQYKQKFSYLLSCLKKHLCHDRFSCPSCNHNDLKRIDRKYIFTALYRCKDCQLLFRAPTTNSEENASFYQKQYNQGFTTDLPKDETLKKYLEQKFLTTEKDYSVYINILRKILPNTSIRLFDFGCSWGYGSWQLIHNGFDVEGYEISAHRADYARTKLGIKVHSSISEVAGKFDCFFSCHVLEHLPSVKEAINFGFHILKPGGFFFAVTPNGSEIRRAVAPDLWHQQWGLVHPNMIDDKFYASTFVGKPYFLSANPYPRDQIANWRNTDDQTIGELSGPELLIIARK